MSHKTPSVILLDQDKNFHSFGYEAEDKYAQLTRTKKHKEWHYFTEIKMKLMNAMDTYLKGSSDQELFEERLTKDVTIKDMEKREYPLLDIMSMAYRYLIDHFLKQLDDKSLLKDITPSTDILWVLTVPAIWTDASKQFTKEAAIKAGLSENQIILTYEPEAAALYCRLLPVDKFISGGKEKALVFSTFERGKKFMVLDLGGGTVDISVQETTLDGKMKSIHKVCGGAWGGQAVDEEFRKCIVKIFGGDVLHKFRTDYRAKYLEFMRDFELKKRQTKLTSDAKVALRVPAELCDLQEDATECSLKEVLADSPLKYDVGTIGDKLLFTNEYFISFFSDAMGNIQEHMEDIFENERCKGLTGILLVGGFAESELVIETLRNAFPNQKFIVPSEAGLSVVKGAVLYGQDPEIITARTCRYTYGVSLHHPFIEGFHSPSKRIIISEQYRCDNCFSKLFTVGELVHLGDTKSMKAFRDYRDPERQHLRYLPLKELVVISSKENPIYSDEKGVTILGSIEIPLSKEKWPEYFNSVIYMEVAGTEIEVRCVLDSGETVKGRFEFLTN
ncbi:hypothetical protein FSP39_012955 [Pinctada imbricata]|uniref:Heat shock 70 kDa protein 12A n=1 Tax=Pinctada imbricata TaxID=66713 RepID=A0AA89C6D9_PINIB|nr:hypothetical protein FSP39_012955 [Pinctada imbricata]